MSKTPIELIELKERAKRHGYRVEKRGDQYKLIGQDGGAHVSGSLDGVNEWLDLIEQGKIHRPGYRIS